MTHVPMKGKQKAASTQLLTTGYSQKLLRQVGGRAVHTNRAQAEQHPASRHSPFGQFAEFITQY